MSKNNYRFISFRFSAVLYTLAKQAKELNYKKLNLQVNNRIQKLRIPSTLQEQVDVSEILLDQNNLSTLVLILAIFI